MQLTKTIPSAALLALVLLSCPARAPGAVFKAPDGFSFEHPDGWNVGTNINATTGSPYDNVIEVKFSAIPVQPGPSGLTASIVAVVTRERAASNEYALRDAKNRMPDILRKQGMTISDLEGSVIQVAGRKAISVTYIAHAPGRSLALRQWLVQTTGGQKAYTVTFSAAAGEFDKYRPIFQKVLDTMQVPGEPQSEGLIGPLLSGGLNWAIIAAVGVVLVAGIVVLVVVLRKKKSVPPLPVFGTQGVPSPYPYTPPGTGPSAYAPPQAPAVPRAGATGASALEALAARQETPAQPPLTQPTAAPDEFIRVQCLCGQKIKVPRSASGKKAKCPKCGGVVQIP